MSEPVFSNGYKYRRKITIPYSKVSGSADLTDFRAFILLDHPDFKSYHYRGLLLSYHTTGFLDIRIEDTSGNQITHEVQRYIPNQGKVAIWINIATFSHTSDTELYVYYGKTELSATEEGNPWGNVNYRAVHHLSGGLLKDSTGVLGPESQTNHGTISSDNSPMLSGRSFDGVDDWIGLGNFFHYNRPIFMSAWVKLDPTILVQGGIISLDDMAQANYYGATLFIRPEGVVSTQVGNGAVGGPTSRNSANTPDGSFPLGSWAKVDVELTAYNSAKTYINGVAVSNSYSGSYSGNPVYSSAEARLGIYDEPNNLWLKGYLAEVRVGRTALNSASYIATEYTNQSNPAGFYTLGNAEQLIKGVFSDTWVEGVIKGKFDGVWKTGKVRKKVDGVWK